MNLQETIRKVLREQVNEAYLKPNEKSEKFILGKLNNMGEGTEMYHIKNYKTRHDFEFCKNGKLIMNLALFFEETDDNTPTSDRKFETATLSIPSDFVDGILSTFPVRRNYLYYLIEEWFEDTFLSKISNMMGRNDISVNELSLSDRTYVCVPPMRKPDDVTQDEMIDFILKKTLFRIDDLLRYEKEEPGYIEDLYLKKLRNAEEERLRGGINESDPKTGTGKKPKGSGRRLYTDENPSDTVSVKFRTKEDIVDTLNKDSFKSKPHKRQSQIINLIHQRVRAAYQNAKDPETKQRLKRAYDYIESVKEKSKEKTIRLQKQEQNETISEDKRIVCEKCEWSWDLSDGGNDPYTCHKCGHTNENDLTEYSRTLKNARKQGSGLRFPKSAVKNNPLRFRPYNRETVEEDTQELTEKCWPGYTQKGMKTMFGKRYPNCVKKKKK